MKAGLVSSARLAADSLRLSATNYVAGDAGVIATLSQYRRVERLEELCVKGGLFRGPIFKRLFAAGPRFGEPYVTATDLEQAEVRPTSYLSRRHGALLNRLSLKEDSVVVSCSGVNLGKSFLVRRDMLGMIASHDLIRILPDKKRIARGYLFAFLDSKFGRAAIRRNIHGGSVRHIEPDQLRGLPVARIAAEQESEIARLVEGAAKALSEHAFLLEAATTDLIQKCNLSLTDIDVWESDARHLGWQSSSPNSESLRALNFDPRAATIRARLESKNHSHLGALCAPEFFRGKQVFTRIDASPEHGVLLLGQRAAFRLRPEGRFIARRTAVQNTLRVPPGTTLIPSHGTLGLRELYCRAIAVTPRMASYAFSGDFFRCVPIPGAIRPGFLYAFLRSRHAFRLLRSLSSGGKQQELVPDRMALFPVPRLAERDEAAIADRVDRALDLLDRAVFDLDWSRVLVERAVQESGQSSAG